MHVLVSAFDISRTAKQIFVQFYTNFSTFNSLVSLGEKYQILCIKTYMTFCEQLERNLATSLSGREINRTKLQRRTKYVLCSIISFLRPCYFPGN
jgi:hypothetical protein